MRRLALTIVAMVAAMAMVACGDVAPTGPAPDPVAGSGTQTAEKTSGTAYPSEGTTGSEVLEESLGPDLDLALLAPAFTFRRPLPESGLSTPYDGELLSALGVRICAWDGDACVTETAHFTSQTGPGSETIRLDSEDETYRTSWHTGDFDLTADQIYRIHVEVAGLVVGAIDVIPAANGGEVRNLTTDTEIGLVDGRTLPVAFAVGSHPILTAWRALTEGLAAAETTVLLRDDHGLAARDAAEVLATVGYGPSGIAAALRTTYALSAAAAGSILLELTLVTSPDEMTVVLAESGYGILEIAGILRGDAFSLTAAEALETLLGGGFGLPEVGQALVEVYGRSTVEVAALLHGSGLPVADIGDWVLDREGGDLAPALSALHEAGLPGAPVGDWLADGRGLALTDAASGLKTAGYDVVAVGDWTVTRTPDGSVAGAVDALRTVGFDAVAVGGWLRSSLAASAAEATDLLTAAGYPTTDVGDALADAYDLGLQVASEVLHDAGHTVGAVGTWYAGRLEAAGETAEKAAESTVGLFRQLGASAAEAGDWLIDRVGEPAWEFATRALATAGYVATDVVVWLDSRSGLAAETLGGFLQNAGYTAVEAADALLNGLNATASEVAGVLADLYGVGAATAAAILTDLGLAAAELGDGLVFAYALGSEVVAEILYLAGHTLDAVGAWYAGNLEAAGHTAAAAVEFTVALLESLGAGAQEAGDWAIARLGEPAWEFVTGVLARAGYAASDAVAWLDSTTGLSPEAIAGFLQKAGYTSEAAARALLAVLNVTKAQLAAIVADVYGVGVARAAEILDVLGANSVEIAAALKSAYAPGAATVAAVLADLGYGIVQIYDALVDVFGLTFDAAVEALVGAGFQFDEVLAALEA